MNNDTAIVSFTKTDDLLLSVSQTETWHNHVYKLTVESSKHCETFVVHLTSVTRLNIIKAWCEIVSFIANGSETIDSLIERFPGLPLNYAAVLVEFTFDYEDKLKKILQCGSSLSIHSENKMIDDYEKRVWETYNNEIGAKFGKTKAVKRGKKKI